MPIKPENKARYPKNWKDIRARILQRANNRCEFCGVENHTYRLNPQDRQERIYCADDSAHERGHRRLL